MTKPQLIFKVLKELGVKTLSQYGLYWLGLHTGYYRKVTPERGKVVEVDEKLLRFRLPFPLPDKEQLMSILDEEAISAILSEAKNVCKGEVRLFGANWVPLVLALNEELEHWTVYAMGKDAIADKHTPVDWKLVWEHGRFGWVLPLAQAYILTGDENYAEVFWDFTLKFLLANPVNMGPHWMSAQEVAIRLMALTFALGVFYNSVHSIDERKYFLAKAIAQHAERIPPTLVYARSQRNNHLLTEAAGLLTAGLVLPQHPSAEQWRRDGWSWLNKGFQDQIAEDGSYIQQSTNYHRLMLQVALWVNTVVSNAPEELLQFSKEDVETASAIPPLIINQPSSSFPEATNEKLVKAVNWLADLLEESNGRVPNLGPNDGAYLFPLTSNPFDDFRPVLKAASMAFVGKPLLPSGIWDEMALWFLGSEKLRKMEKVSAEKGLAPKQNPTVIRLNQYASWGYLRSANFYARPGHADQLHFDLWWNGVNIARDAGTYRYTDAKPWDNALTTTQVHNTITIERKDQMTPVGRFLYLDWAQAYVISHNRSFQGGWENLVVQHDGYKRLGVIHQRSVTAIATGNWLIEDTLTPVDDSQKLSEEVFRFSLHWLVPDWEWEIPEAGEENLCVIRLLSPYGWIILNLETHREQSVEKTNHLNAEKSVYNCRIIRAGKLLYGDGKANPVMGWYSPTYNVKEAAVSIELEIESQIPFTITSEWQFPEE